MTSKRGDKLSYYTVDKVLEIIRGYSNNIQNAKESMEYASVGVAQYGIEATMPRGNTTSDVVANEAIRMVTGTGYFANMITDIKYLQDRWDRVTNEKDATVLNLRLDGLSSAEIGQILGCSERNVNIVLRRVAETIISCPQ